MRSEGDAPTRQAPADCGVSGYSGLVTPRMAPPYARLCGRQHPGIRARVMHDLGKVAVLPAIPLKPEPPMPDERCEMPSHARAHCRMPTGFTSAPTAPGATR
jgi:hypothetical protein